MRARRAAVAALITVGILGMSAGHTSAAPRDFFGVATGDDKPTAQDFQGMAAAKVAVARIPFHWPTIQPTPGAFDWSKLDPVVAAAASSGIKLLPFLYGTPAWAANCAGIPPNFCERVTPLRSANGAAAWAAFVGEAVRRYGPSGTFWTNPTDAFNPPFLPIRTWQDWNEQNSSTYYRPAPNPREYARLHGIFAQAIKASDPGATLLIGGLFGTPPKPSFSAWKFVEKLYRVKGFKAIFDAIAVHPYAGNNKGIELQLQRIREVQKERKDAKTPIALTELGWSSAPVGTGGSPLYKGVAGQASQLRSSFKFVLKNRKRYKINSLYYFSWRDITAGSGGQCIICETSGLLTAGFAPKPSFGQFVRFTGGR